MASIEEKIEEYYKKKLDAIGLRHFGKTEKINDSIDNALKEANSKSGGNGANYPDIKCLLNNKHGRTIPVMIEAKGSKGRLEKLTKNGDIAGVLFKDEKANTSAIQNFAVNGALHYGRAILDYSTYSEVIVIGINGSTLDASGQPSDAEYKAYYVSKKNHFVPKLIDKLDSEWALLAPVSVSVLCSILDDMNLTDSEREKLNRVTEATLEDRIHSIHQSIYDDNRLRTHLGTNEKLYLFCGLIMAGLTIEKVAPLSHSDFKGNDIEDKNDGTVVIEQIRAFLKFKKCSKDKIEMILGLLSPVFKNRVLWRPVNGESILKSLFLQVQTDIIPILESNLHLDFTGKILNKLSDWVNLENDAVNDVVLTPRYVTSFMARLARTDMNSFVWDRAMGSAGFLVSAMDIMLKDAQHKIVDKDKLEDKIRKIKEEQLLGIEILGNIYILAVLNMILMGDGSSNIIKGDSHAWNGNFPATVFLLNPPYSAPGKGFIFVEEALKAMTTGYACILIQESAGSGQGQPYTSRILRDNTLLASIHMPSDLFGGKASVQAAIYLFKVARPHELDDIVTFIDMAEDGYARQNRKKSNSNVNLRDVDHAADRYAEVEAILLGKMPKTNYYTVENGKVVTDVITFNGEDWCFSQHKKINTQPNEDDFKAAAAEYFSWKTSKIINESLRINHINIAEPYAWKEFTMDEIFDITKGKRLIKEHQTTGNTLFIGATSENHGETARIGQEALFPPNTITVSYNGSVGEAFYQEEPYWASDDINVLTLKNHELNKNIAMYLCAVIRKAGKLFYYNQKWNLERMKLTKISLPVIENGTPDWYYMNAYIAATEQFAINSVEHLKNNLK